MTWLVIVGLALVAAATFAAYYFSVWWRFIRGTEVVDFSVRIDDHAAPVDEEATLRVLREAMADGPRVQDFLSRLIIKTVPADGLVRTREATTGYVVRRGDAWFNSRPDRPGAVRVDGSIEIRSYFGMTIYVAVVALRPTRAAVDRGVDDVALGDTVFFHEVLRHLYPAFLGFGVDAEHRSDSTRRLEQFAYRRWFDRQS